MRQSDRQNIVVIAAIVFSTIVTRAQDDKNSPEETLLGRLGVHTDQSVTAANCTVKIDINEKSFLHNLDLLKGFLDEGFDISAASKPHAFTETFAIMTLPFVTKQVYKKFSDADKC
jgi:hypothetical protein